MKKSTVLPHSETIKLWLPDANKTASAGASLAASLYGFPVDILLTGPLGAGKTAFIQGFAQGLGIRDTLSSPTYALEQRYTTSSGIPFIHIDLYRLKENQAAELIDMTDDHTGIRCIEWADRIKKTDHRTIHIDLSEENNGRNLTVTFDDMPLPIQEDITEWRQQFRLPDHIAAHCDTVGELSRRFAEHIIRHGTIARPAALECAGRIHDLFRFIDFTDGTGPKDHVYSAQDTHTWNSLKEQYVGMTHEGVCAAFLQKKGYSCLAPIVALHGLRVELKQRTTIDQKILYYADKRVMLDKIVSIDERFADLRQRYAKGKLTEESARWLHDAYMTEKELFPDGPPL